MLKKTAKWLWEKLWGPPTKPESPPTDLQNRWVGVEIERLGVHVSFKGQYRDLLDLLTELSGESWRDRDGFFPKGNDDEPTPEDNG